MKVLHYIQANSKTIIEYTQNHFILVTLAILISLVVWVPVGLLLTKSEKWARFVIGLANTLFCVPSLALFAIMVTIPALGLGRRSALLALVLYAMMPLVRNVYQGAVGVDKNVIEAARGMGMTSGQIMREIQLPLAMPVIFAGFRITVVMTTGIAAIGAYIGERNLGRLISEGLVRSNTEMVIAGAVLISLIAILFDTILGVFEKKVVPRGLRVRGGAEN